MKKDVRKLKVIAILVIALFTIASMSSCNKIERDTSVIITDSNGVKDTLQGNVACTNEATYITVK